MDVTELDAVVQSLGELRKEADEKKAALTEVNKKITALEDQIVKHLKDMKRDSYQTPFGTAYIIQKWNVKTPKTDEDKKAFFSWLEENEIFLAYATVNSQSLNALYREKMQAAKDSGELLSIPGLEAPTLYEGLGFRKGK